MSRTSERLKQTLKIMREFVKGGGEVLFYKYPNELRSKLSRGFVWKNFFEKQSSSLACSKKLQFFKVQVRIQHELGSHHQKLRCKTLCCLLELQRHMRKQFHQWLKSKGCFQVLHQRLRKQLLQ